MADDVDPPVAEEKLVEEANVEPAQEELPLAEATAEEKPAEEVKAEEAPEPAKEEPPVDWRDRELKSKHRQLQQEKREKAELQAKVAALEAINAAGGQTADKTIASVVSNDDVEKRAQELLAQQRYVENCNKAAEAGEKAFGESWKYAVQNLELLGGFDMPTMNGVMATDDPAKVLFELGKDPDKYHRLMEMPYEKRIIEMGKIAMQPVAPKKVSDAPPPVSTVGGRAAPAAATLSDKLDDDAWYAVRAAQRQKRYEQKNGIRR